MRKKYIAVEIVIGWEKYVFKCLCLISEILGFKAPRHLIYGVGGRERGVMKGETNNTDDDDDDDDLYIMVKCVWVCHEKVTKFV